MGNLRTRLSIPTPEESYNALFGETVKDGIQQLSLADLHPYPNQPFKPYTTSRLQELAEDITQNGVLCPIIVRPMPEGGDHSYSYYQILAGHNRVAAANMAGLEAVPAIVREVSDDEAALIMVNTNLNQRDKLLPSEKALAYKMQLDAMKRQSGQPKKNLSHDETNYNSGEKFSEANNESRANVFRYIRLTYLIPSLLKMVDDERLTFMAGVYLSYLSADEQEISDAYLKEHSLQLSVEQAENIKKFSQGIGKITFTELNRMFYPAKPIKEAKRTVQFTKPILNKALSYIPNELTGKEAANYIITALEFYNNR